MSELIESVKKSLFIGGQWVSAEGGKTLEVCNPADGSLLGSVADGSPSDGLRALDAAVDAAHDWARSEPRVRSEMLRKAFELLIERADDFAMLMTLEMGKPLA